MNKSKETIGLYEDTNMYICVNQRNITIEHDFELEYAMTKCNL